MDDKRFDNDGNIIGQESSQPNWPNDTASETSSPDWHTVPNFNSYEEPPRRRFPWARMALIFIILAAGLYAAGTFSGAGGRYFYIENGRLGTASRGSGGHTAAEPGPFQNINVNVSSSRVIILPGDSYRVVTPTGRNAPTVNVSNGELTIASRPQGGVVSFGINTSSAADHEIRIYLPVGHDMDGIRVRTSSGRIQIDGVNAGYIDVNSSSGRVEVTNLTTPLSRVSLRSSSGRISLENVQMAEDLTLQTSSGRIELDRVAWGSLSARTSSGRINITRGQNGGGAGSAVLQTSSGSVNVEIAGSRDDYRYELSTSSGSMRVDGERFSGRNAAGGQGDNEINVRTSSGSIRLDFTR